MTRERAWVTIGAALCGFALGYALPVYAHLPSLFYDPQQRRWWVAALPGAVAIGYYGQMLWGAALALGTGGAAWTLGARRRAAAAPLAGLFAAWALSALVLVAGWFTWNNWP